MKKLLLMLAALLTIGVGPPRDWNAVVTRQPSGAYLIGNPAAKVKLVEYLSYTCPHCADFLQESAPVLRGQMVKSGSVSIELRNAVREQIDLSAALLARCAGAKDFVGMTDAMFAQQSQWYGRAYNYEQLNSARLGMYPNTVQLRMLAKGGGLADLMRARGMSDAAFDACFDNKTELAVILQLSERAWPAMNAAAKPLPGGTPSFAINGKMVVGVGWPGLEKLLRAAGAK
ncbi:MAG: DsbA family protein [Pseudomonadota bacterium]|nr:DsbA family protein [Pseudomonadota bacterium]